MYESKKMDTQRKMQLYREGVAYGSSEWVKKTSHQKINTLGTERLIELIEILFAFSGERPDGRSGFPYSICT